LQKHKVMSRSETKKSDLVETWQIQPQQIWCEKNRIIGLLSDTEGQTDGRSRRGDITSRNQLAYFRVIFLGCSTLIL